MLNKILTLSSWFIWLVAIAIFCVFLILLSNNIIDFSKASNPINTLMFIAFLTDIGVGVIAFIHMFISGFRRFQHKLKGKLNYFSKNKINRGLILAVVILLLLVVGQATGIVQFAGVEESKPASKSEINNTTVPIEKLITPSSDPTPIPTPKQVKQVYVDPDPIIDCNIHANCGGGTKRMKKSECDQSICCNINSNCGGGAKITTKSLCNQQICCQIGDKWSLYPSNEKCDQDQDAYWKNRNISGGSTYTPPTATWDPNKEYTNCAVANVNTNQLDHFYITYTECTRRQNEALAKLSEASKKSLEESQQRSKEIEAASQYQEALNKACTQVQSDWYDYKVEFYATEYNNFSSSAEAVQELSRRRDVYQSEANKAGCNMYLSM